MVRQIYDIENSKSIYSTFKKILELQPTTLTEVAKKLEIPVYSLSERVLVLEDAKYIKKKQSGGSKIITVNNEKIKTIYKIDPQDEVNKEIVFDNINSFSEINVMKRLLAKSKRADRDLYNLLGVKK